MIEINKPAPNFETEAFHEGKVKKISLSAYRGKWVVLAFYPADFTFVCPTELGELADYYDEFKSINTEILSVSKDTVFVHKAWHDNSPTIKKIKYPMIADPSGKICNDYGTTINDGNDMGLSSRASFIIDPEGIVKWYELHDNSIGRSAAEILRKLQASQFVKEHGQVCPAGWTPGKAAITKGLDLVGKI